VVVGTPARAAPPGHFVDEVKLPFDAIPGIASERVRGVHDKAGDRIEVPANWNGRLVIWAHGDGQSVRVNPASKAADHVADGASRRPAATANGSCATSDVLDGVGGHPTAVDAVGQHLTDVLADFGIDQPIELVVHREQQFAVS